MQFQLVSDYQPAGDQAQAIDNLVKQVEANQRHNTLLGVTGSGKTFTMANVIAKTQRPTLILAHNKTLAAQLYQEVRDFFPHNAVSYFVSYYDYYQPEAYVPSSDTYIEKETSINDEIDKLRLATTTNLLTRPDVIVVASVSCIYNLGSPVEYGRFILKLMEGEIIDQQTLLLRLSDLQYSRSTGDLERGTFRLRGDTIQLWPAYQDTALQIDTLEDTIERMTWIDPISGQAASTDDPSDKVMIFPAKHYVVDPKSQQEAFAQIRRDAAERVEYFKQQDKLVEAYRIEQRVNYDLEMIQEFGSVNGIENYSRYFDGRKPGDPPYTLLDYFHENATSINGQPFLTIIDESHITLSQIRGMYNGDRARKQTLIDYGFRLPAALDNRPLTYEEFAEQTQTMLYVSATPKEYEISLSNGKVVEQLVRPTGLIDPEIELRPVRTQIPDLILEILVRKQRGQRTLVTTLTKKMAEALTDYLNDPQKLKTVVSNYATAQLARVEQTDPDTPLRANQNLTNEELTLGPISPQLYSQPNPSHFSLEPLTQHLPKVAYLHSDIDTLERSDILDDLRRGEYDVLVGINLLREGLDLPEVSLVAILDADKEGFLRSATSLVQTIGRAARHVEGRAILYADKLTKSMIAAITETNRRRQVQLDFNHQHGITPQGITKKIRQRMVKKSQTENHKTVARGKGGAGKPHKPLVIQLTKKEAIDLNNFDPSALLPNQRNKLKPKLTRAMNQAAKDLEYEQAAKLRDVITSLG